MRRSRIVLGVAFIGVALLAFAGGMEFQHTRTKTLATTPAAGQFGSTNPSGSGRFSGFGGQRPTFGQVTSISGSTMVVQNQSGSSVTVSLSGNPAITDATGATVTSSDIQVGETVVVSGTTSSDGTITATRIRLNPSFGNNSSSGATNGT